MFGRREMVGDIGDRKSTKARETDTLFTTCARCEQYTKLRDGKGDEESVER